MATNDANEYLAKYLAQQAAEKNPTGIFGLKQTPFLTPADQRALRFQQLSQAVQSSPQYSAALGAGQGLGNALGGLGGNNPSDSARPPDPQVLAKGVYDQILQQTGNPYLARRQAYNYLAQQGVSGAMEELYKTEKDYQEQINKDRDFGLSKQEKSFTSLGNNARGQEIIQNELGKKESVGSGPLVSVTVGEQGAEEKGVGEYWAKKFGSIVDGGDKARALMNDMHALKGLLSEVGGGRLTETGYEIASVAKSFGFDINDKLSNVDAASAIFNKMALALRSTADGEGMPGAMSDKDREFLRSMTPSLAKTPEGRAKLFEYYEKVYQRQMFVAKQALEYRQKNKHMDEGFVQAMNKYADDNPMFAQALPKIKNLKVTPVG